MINKNLIHDRIALINKAVTRLSEFTKYTQNEFSGDPDNFAIAEHNLRIALEGIFDIGRHILVKTGLGKPEDYRQILILLQQNKIIPCDFFERIKGMAGYRNRLVHLYNEIDNQELYEIIINKLDDFTEYASYILKYITQIPSI